ncbi:hypothetical protein AK812_SmicGene6967 [Symbiodinium microadriaticum]|uniref:Uncharacterized protein n=1 Tax=Symbiodinium microadriaticum TaxID=2951 RepID=A0A1Q9EPY6_SYMMI|nr:hypothetical protein AK812_SmicGene6967 [Symbiodinium microadriaticum]
MERRSPEAEYFDLDPPGKAEGPDWEDELRSAQGNAWMRSPTPSVAPRSPSARSNTPSRERNIEEELRLAIGGWEDCRRDEAVEEAKAILRCWDLLGGEGIDVFAFQEVSGLKELALLGLEQDEVQLETIMLLERAAKDLKRFYMNKYSHPNLREEIQAVLDSTKAGKRTGPDLRSIVLSSTPGKLITKVILLRYWGHAARYTPFDWRPITKVTPSMNLPIRLPSEATQHLRSQNVMLQSLVLRVQVMKKESSLFQEQAASVARALDQMTTFRTQSEDLVKKVDTTAGQALDRLMVILPNYVSKNLVQGIQFVLQTQTQPDDQSILTHLRQIYLALQPTRILQQNVQLNPTQSALDDLQGSLQQWMEGKIVEKLSALIDILRKLQVEVTTMNDATGHNRANKVVEYLEQLFECHDAQKDRSMELSSQLHAVMNHVKSACGLCNSNLSQVNAVSNTQWTHGDLLNSLETLRKHDEKLKKQSDAISKVQSQLEKILLKLTPAMPTKAPLPPPPGATTNTYAGATSSTTPTQPTATAPQMTHPTTVPQACSPPQGSGDPPIIRLSNQMGPRQPLQPFENLGVPANRWPQPAFDTRDPHTQQALAYLLGIFGSQ